MLKQDLWKRLIVILGALVLLVVVCLAFTGYRYRLLISVPAGKYDKDIKILAMIMHSGDIYYTTDGTEPSPDGETSVLYDEPVVLKAEEHEQVTTIKWKAYFSNGESSSTVTRTYMVGKNVEDRYSTYIVSISTDPDNLYGYENGIFVPGKIRDDYIKQNPGEEITAYSPANYNVRGIESERKVHVEMFLEDGTEIISQDCGIRTGGDTSRSSEQTPFRLYARGELYGTKTFEYNFFDKDQEQSDLLTGYTSFNTLYFRNSGNDRQEAYIRDELVQQLARDAGFLDTQYTAPACVYINGEYKGFYWIHSQYNQSYFKQRYGKYNGDMVVIGKSEKEMNTTTSDELSNHYAAEYMEQYQYFIKQDLTDDAVFEQLNAFMDVENYLQYYAIEIYCGNEDWPEGNLKAYRYVSPKKNYTPNTVFDGRYRYLLYDVDTSLGRGYISDNIDPWVSVDKLDDLLNGNDAPLLKAILQRQDCREYFTNYMYYLMDEVFTPEHVNETLDKMDASRRQELDYYIEYMTGYDANEYKYLDMQLNTIKTWAVVSADPMKYKLQDLWGLVGTVQ